MAEDKKEPGTALAPLPADLAAMVTVTRPEQEGEGPPSHIGPGDIRMPRLALAQKTSKEIDPGEAGRFIEGLRFTEMFHSGDGRRWGNGPVLFCVLRSDPPRHIEFRPMDQGGGVLDMDVAPHDPRTKFTTDEGGKSVPPKATKFYDFMVMVLNGFDPADPMNNVMALSLKSTAIKVAKDLNKLITFRGKKDLFRGVYRLESGSDKNAKGSFAVYKVSNAGWLQEGTPAFAAAEEMWGALKNARIVVDREQPNPDDPADLEREEAARREAEKDIPF